MSRTILAAAFILLLLPVSGFSQLKQQAEPVSFSKLLTNTVTNPGGLVGLVGLNPNRFSMQQSFSLSMLSAGGHSFSQGVYLNTMGYQISDATSVAMQWGIMNQPLSSLGVPSLYQSGFFFSGARFDYKPSESLQFGIEVSRTPYSPYYANPYRWYDRPYNSPFKSEQDELSK